MYIELIGFGIRTSIELTEMIHGILPAEIRAGTRIHFNDNRQVTSRRVTISDVSELELVFAKATRDIVFSAIGREFPLFTGSIRCVVTGAFSQPVARKRRRFSKKRA